MLIVLASHDQMRQVKVLMDNLSTGDYPPELPIPRIYRLARINATPAADALNRLFHAPGVPPRSDPQFLYREWVFNAAAFEPGNCVLMVGSNTAIEKATQILGELDRPPQPATVPATTQASEAFRIDLSRPDK